MMNLVEIVEKAFMPLKAEASLADVVNAFQLALGLFALSHSMYIKDADEDILKKNSVWKKMYEEIKGSFSSLYPQPVPIQG